MKPKYLIPPCGKSRASILAWLNSFSPRGWHGDGDFKFCFNVKVYSVDLSFDKLWERYKESGYAHSESPRYLDACKELYAKYENELWNWGVESACEGIKDDDAYNMLWNGKSTPTELGFHGRSGGWLVLESFCGIRLDADIDLDGLDFTTLRDLAEMVQWIKYTTGGGKPAEAIEHAAAFTFFANICDGRVKSDADVAAVQDERAALRTAAAQLATA